MKNTDHRLIKILCGMVFLIILPLIAYEFYLWKAHGYRADYNLRQTCIEVFPRDLELEEKCNALD